MTLTRAGRTVNRWRRHRVAVPRLARALPELTSFSEHLASQGVASSSRLVSWEALSDARDGKDGALASPDAPNPRLFGSIHADLARIVRLRLANASPVGLHTTLVPLDIADAIGFTAERLRDDEGLSLYRELERAGYALSTAEEHLHARLVTRAEARLLGVPPRAAALSVLRLSREPGGRLLEAVRAVYLGDKYDYVITLERTRPERRH